MPLTSNYYNTDMTNKWLTQPAFTKDGSLQSFKQNNTGFDASSLPFGDQNAPVMGQERSSRLDSGFFDQLSFGEKLGLNNSCGSDKLTGTVRQNFQAGSLGRKKYFALTLFSGKTATCINTCSKKKFATKRHK